MTFIIMIDEPKDYACPGQTIVGKAYCILKNPRFLEVKLKLTGEECTYYTDPTNKSISIGGRCLNLKFLKTGILIIRRGYFNVGEHKFPFKLTLPMCIPSTYNGKYGYVKYMFKAEMVTSPREIERDEIEFKVFAPIDLKNMPKASMVPSTHSDKMATKRWFCFPDTIHIDVKLEKNAFVVGEVINVEVELASNSSLTISAVTVELYLKITARVAGQVRGYMTVCQLLASDQATAVNPHNSKTYLSQLKVPIDSEIPNFQKCNLLSQKSFLEVAAVLKNRSKSKVKVEVEIILGHYLDGGQGALSKNAKDSVIDHPLHGLLATHFSRAIYNNFNNSTTTQTVCPYSRDEPTTSRRGEINPLYRSEGTCPYTTDEEAPLLSREMPISSRVTLPNSDMRPSAPQLSDIADINDLEDALPSLSNRASAPPILQLPTPPNSDAEETDVPVLTGRHIWFDVPPSYEEACKMFKNKTS